MGEILLICSVITLVLLVLFIHKKKDQERQYSNMMRNRSMEDSARKKNYYYSRDDSAINRVSPFRSAEDSSTKYEYIRNRNMTVLSPREYNYYDRFNYGVKRNDSDYSFNYLKNCVCDGINCKCYRMHSRAYCTPSNYNYNNIPENVKLERKDSYFNDLKSENLRQQQIEKDNNSYNKLAANPSKMLNHNRENNSSNAYYNNNNSQSLNYQNNYISSKINQNNCAPYNYNSSSIINNSNIPFNNQNLLNLNNNPGYKVIKLEDFLEKEKKDCSPIYKRKNEITLDDVHHSLIKFVKNEVDEKHTSPNKSIPVVKPNEINLRKSDDNFLNELIPKKIDFSALLNDTQEKQKIPEDLKLSTPLVKIDKAGFESFGENNQESFKSVKST
jgi:hypothetical protein